MENVGEVDPERHGEEQWRRKEENLGAMDGRKQVTVPETVTLGEKERKAPFPLKGKGPNDDDD